jgi:hypothetical protein
MPSFKNYKSFKLSRRQSSDLEMHDRGSLHDVGGFSGDVWRDSLGVVFVMIGPVAVVDLPKHRDLHDNKSISSSAIQKPTALFTGYSATC